jgi:cellulose synthase/poly-beta-1,6-N-acetylglucosamine synthase-like glycosyltransferase
MSASSGSPKGIRRFFEHIRTPFQVACQQLVLFGLPFVIYTILDRLGFDITGVVYLALVAAMTLTAVAILAESRAALRRPVLPPAPDGPMPPATAIIAAYLPNEADTIVETVAAFLSQDYPDLQVILAYNTPRPMPVEGELRQIAERDSRFEAVQVEGSVSKAQNVNAVLDQVRGEFVGLFDADHHPEPGSYKRAWRWIASGVGIVQGHCLVRNGSTNFVTKLIATEFEAIYAVSHPGRARLHGFGIFGGSNGYWRTALLRRTRMRGFMLTEDIDSSMRVVKAGETIVSDPNLVSTELAPETLGALWNQRLRWAQGWSQVSRRHLVSAVRTMPTSRNRLGITYLLGWREVYPWLAMQMVPLLAFWWVRGKTPMNWFVPFFAATSLFTLSAGPIQGWFAWKLAHPSIRRHRRWFVLFVLTSIVFYTEFKNLIARTAHIKEVMRERKWKVTPRSPQTAREPAGQSELPASLEGETVPLTSTYDAGLGLLTVGVGADEPVDAHLVGV